MERLNILLNQKALNPREYEEMVNLAIEEVKGMYVNYYGMIMCLNEYSCKQTAKKKYITKYIVVKAQERIDTILRLKKLGLLK